MKPCSPASAPRGRPPRQDATSSAAIDLTQAALPYAPEALEPHIDAVTMGIHHGKHHAAYIKNLGDALKAALEAGYTRFRPVCMTALAMIIGMLLGVLLAVMAVSRYPAVQAMSHLYVWVFRGTPLLVQLIFWFNIALVFPVVGIGAWQIPINTLVTPFAAALLGLGLVLGAQRRPFNVGFRDQGSHAGSLGCAAWHCRAGHRAAGLRRCRPGASSRRLQSDCAGEY